nr:MAG TPA: hypothetical protein [Caudoviricetes sp.]
MGICYAREAWVTVRQHVPKRSVRRQRGRHSKKFWRQAVSASACSLNHRMRSSLPRSPNSMVARRLRYSTSCAMPKDKRTQSCDHHNQQCP